MPNSNDYPCFAESINHDPVDFLLQLGNSLSLNWEEKMRVILEMPVLSGLQVTALIEVFEEEQEKFMSFAEEEADDLAILVRKNQQIWEQLQKEISLPDLQPYSWMQMGKQSENTSCADKVSDLLADL